MGIYGTVADYHLHGKIASMDKYTYLALNNLMASLKGRGIDDECFDDFMAVTDWLRDREPLYVKTD
jgi:hypothetical protein